MKIVIVLFFALSIQIKAITQVVVGYFPFQSLLSVSSNPKKTLWVETKIETNTFFSNLNTEFTAKYNWKNTDHLQCYAGVGISINPANTFNNSPLSNGYLIDIGVRGNPLKKWDAFVAVFEVSPYINREGEGGNLRTRLGIAYQFTKKKKRTKIS